MKPYVVIITGMSGSGKTTYLKALEDAGFYAMDNMPIEMIPQVLSHILKNNPEIDRFALVVDVRDEGFGQKFPWLVERLSSKYRTHVIFLDSVDEELTRRFKIMRRKHPLQEGRTLQEAIREEREILQVARKLADAVVNTTGMGPGTLRERAVDLHLQGITRRVVLMSFGFSSGIPQEADFVFDLRALPNPHWDDRLRPFTGKDPQIKEFLLAHPQVHTYLKALKEFFQKTLPLMFEDGRAQVVLAFGCTGGRHRSVFFVEELYNWFRNKWSQYVIEKKHREESG